MLKTEWGCFLYIHAFLKVQNDVVASRCVAKQHRARTWVSPVKWDLLTFWRLLRRWVLSPRMFLPGSAPRNDSYDFKKGVDTFTRGGRQNPGNPALTCCRTMKHHLVPLMLVKTGLGV